MAAANPSSSIIIFLLLTLAYSMFKYYTKNDSTMKIWTIIYFLSLILSQFFINLGLTGDICGFKQYGVAIQATLVPWLLIFGVINFLLIMFPNWLMPFSNTIGYLFAYITGINSFFKKILKDRKTMDLGKNQTSLVSALNNIYEDKSLLINSMTNENVLEWWNSMVSGNLLQKGVGDTQFNELKDFVKMKTEIAKFIWYALTGLLTTSVSYNTILNSGCKQSVKEMTKRHNEYMEQEKKIEEEKQHKDKSKIVYKSYE
jgi:hypothetical protein|tara:strand:+ start:4867 stop:5640 length:774 start_codon:yes stop_codon:yes gene_type:complete